MPIIKSAKKRVRQTEVRYARNLATKRTMRDKIKLVKAAAESGDSKNISKLLSQAQSAIDTAAKKNVIHKNKASRAKSKLNTLAKNAAPAKKKAPATKTAKKPATTKKKPATVKKKVSAAKKTTKK